MQTYEQLEEQEFLSIGRLSCQAGVVLASAKRHWDTLLLLEDINQSTHIGVDFSSINFRLAGGPDDLKTAFRILRVAGFEPGMRPDTDKKEPEFQTYFNHPDGAKVWLSFSSTLCRRVKTGVRTVEEAVYEIQCDDGADLSAGTQAESSEGNDDLEHLL